MVKRIFTLNFLDSFVFGITTVIVPLLMLERGIGVAAIGLVFAFSPLAKVAVRLASAAAADAFGERLFYTLNALSNFLQAPIYFLSSGALGFGIGKVVDGARESFIWAVNRSSIMHAAPGRKHYAMGGLVSGRAVYFAIGSLAIGALFPLGGYNLLLALVAAIGIAMAAISLKVKDTPDRAKIRLSHLHFLGRERRFYETAGALTVGSAVYSAILYFLLPLFFKLAGFSLSEIGLLYAGYFLLFGVVLNYISHTGIPGRKAALIGALAFAVSLCGIGFAPRGVMPYFFLLMAVGDAHLGLLWEEAIYLQAKGSSRRSTEIAMLHTPGMLAVFAVSCVSGFVVEGFGFVPIFVLGALSEVAFGAWCVRLGSWDSVKRGRRQ